MVELRGKYLSNNFNPLAKQTLADPSADFIDVFAPSANFLPDAAANYGRSAGLASRLAQLRLTLHQNGYVPIPVTAPDYQHPEVKSPGKQPFLKGWRGFRHDTLTAEQIAGWESSARNHPNTGLACGNLVGVDIDIRDAALASRVENMARAMLGNTPLLRIGLPPKRLLAYRAVAPMQKAITPRLNMAGGDVAQVEVLGEGQQFVAFGIHPDTGRPYTWPQSSPEAVALADLPEVSQEAVAAFLAAAEAVLRAAGGHMPNRKEGRQEASPIKPAAPSSRIHPARDFPPPTRTEVESALAAVPNTYGWEGWVSMGAALYDALADDGEDLFASWSAQSPKNDPAATRQKWRSYRTSPAEVTKAWLFHEARRHGWKPAGERIKPARKAEHTPPHEFAEEWPEPLDFLADVNATGAPELRPEHLPEAIAPFVFDTAARMGVDPAAVALSALVALSSIISDEWRIQPKQFDDEWTENPRIWGAIVGDPSMLKTPIIKAATAPIDRMEAEARERHSEAMRRYKAALKAWKDAGSDPEAEPKLPRLDRYMVEGTTIEALTEVLRDDDGATQRAPSRKVLVRQDEMSEWVASFDRYRSGGKGGSDRGAYLRLYNGGRSTIDRIGRGAFAVPNWSACVLGGIQPGPIRAIARDAADDGLLQRFCYCVPARQERGEDRKPDAEALARYRALFPTLAALHPSRSLSGEPQPVKLHADAHRVREDILDLAEALAAMPDASPRMKAALGKWPGLWARMALLFHLIGVADARARQTDERPIVDVVDRGASTASTKYLREVLLPHLLRAEAVMFASEQTGHAGWIAGFLLSQGLRRVAARDIMRAYRPFKAPEQRRELLEVMASLEAMGWLRAEPTRDGRPAICWEVNPKIFNAFSARAEREKAAREATKARIRETLARHLSGRAA